MKIITIVGARPQFIKAAMVSKAICEHNEAAREAGEAGEACEARATGNDNSSLAARASLAFRAISEVLIHTGQHYDHKMSQVFFDQLEIPEPNYHLEIGSGTHGDQTGRMLAAIEKVLLDESPDAVLVYGDTNSTLAGSLAASKLHIPVGHVEGGMRSFNRRMPEELNRVVTDHLATWHFCATETAVRNLKAEGVTEGVHLVGDVMHDAVMLYRDVAAKKSDILQRMSLGGASPTTKYALATIHRAENTDDEARLRNIIEALVEISQEMPVVLPLHPRTRKALEVLNIPPLCKGRSGGADQDCHSSLRSESRGIKVIEPVSYLDMLQLEQKASVILTDSGGMQKEAFWFGVPCVTMRDETEWIETVESGMNKVVGANRKAIVSAVQGDLGKENRSYDSKIKMNASQTIVGTLISQASTKAGDL